MKGNDAYIKATERMSNINVINDSAERGVKLAQDYLKAAKGEEHYHNVLQVVEASRDSRPSLRKRKKHYYTCIVYV